MSRSSDILLRAINYDHTLVLAIELSNKSWVLAAQVPGLPQTKTQRTIEPNKTALLAAIDGYRVRAAGLGYAVERVITTYEAGWSGFWLARWLVAQGIEVLTGVPAGERDVNEQGADRAQLQGRRYLRPRLAYRDVASATNRLTLIAAIVPADAVTTHTLFCLKTDVPLDVQLVLCALLNSFVANYVTRFRVNTHVTASLMSRLPVPYVGRDSGSFARLASLAETLSHSPTAAEEQPEYSELQARVARLYGLAAADFRHVLSTFPLIPDSVKTSCQRQFDSLH